MFILLYNNNAKSFTIKLSSSEGKPLSNPFKWTVDLLNNHIGHFVHLLSVMSNQNI